MQGCIKVSKVWKGFQECSNLRVNSRGVPMVFTGFQVCTGFQGIKGTFQEISGALTRWFMGFQANAMSESEDYKNWMYVGFLSIEHQYCFHLQRISKYFIGENIYCYTFYMEEKNGHKLRYPMHIQFA